MLLKALPSHRLDELARLHQQRVWLRRDRRIDARSAQLCEAALMTRELLIKASLGLYQSQTGVEAVHAELQRREPS